MNFKNVSKKVAYSGVAVFSMLVGIIGSGTLNIAAHAQTANTAAAVTTAPSVAASPAQDSVNNTPPHGTFKPNEDPAHEAKESAQREAQENAGQRPTVQ